MKDGLQYRNECSQFRINCKNQKLSFTFKHFFAETFHTDFDRISGSEVVSIRLSFYHFFPESAGQPPKKEIESASVRRDW